MQTIAPDSTRRNVQTLQSLSISGVYDELTSLERKINLGLMIAAGYGHELWPFVSVLEAASGGRAAYAATDSELESYVFPLKDLRPGTRKRYLGRWRRDCREVNRRRRVPLIWVDFDKSTTRKGNIRTVVKYQLNFLEARCRVIARLPAVLPDGDEERATIFQLCRDVTDELWGSAARPSPVKAPPSRVRFEATMKTAKSALKRAATVATPDQIAERLARDLTPADCCGFASALILRVADAGLEEIDPSKLDSDEAAELFAALSEVPGVLARFRRLLEGENAKSFADNTSSHDNLSWERAAPSPPQRPETQSCERESIEPQSCNREAPPFDDGYAGSREATPEENWPDPDPSDPEPPPPPAPVHPAPVSVQSTEEGAQGGGLPLTPLDHVYAWTSVGVRDFLVSAFTDPDDNQGRVIDNTWYLGSVSHLLADLPEIVERANRDRLKLVLRPQPHHDAQRAEIPRSCWALQVDDLPESALERVRPWALLAVRTSTTVQAWFALRSDRATYETVRRRLIEELGGDSRASGAGRIAGSHNNKPKRRRADGSAPKVSLLWVNHGRIVTERELEAAGLLAPELSAMADIPECAPLSTSKTPLPGKVFDYPRFTPNPADRSGADYSWAKGALRDYGRTIEETAAEMIRLPGSKAEKRGMDYALLTARRAAADLGV
jgi:hypothetical protein